MRKRIIQYAWLIAALLCWQLNLIAQVESQTKQGLRKTTFTTERGEVSVYLPGVLKKGDLISGTVMAEPRGKNDRQWEKNKSVLNGYVIEMEEAPINETSVKNDFFKWTIPATLTGGFLHYVLKDEKGNTVAMEKIAVGEITDFPISSKKLTLPPAIVEDNLVLARSNLFDGDLMNTRIKTGDRPAFILAESPREAFFVCPEDMIGPQTVLVVEGNEAQRQTTNVLVIEMTADRTALMRGQSSNVTIKVRGLENISVPVPLNVVNESTNIINLTGGDQQVITILPNQVNEEGIFIQELTAHARNSGSYVIYADIAMNPILPDINRCPVIPEELLVPPTTPKGYVYVGREVVIGYSYIEELSTVPLNREDQNDDLLFLNSTTEVIEGDITCEYIVTHIFEKIILN